MDGDEDSTTLLCAHCASPIGRQYRFCAARGVALDRLATADDEHQSEWRDEVAGNVRRGISEHLHTGRMVVAGGPLLIATVVAFTLAVKLLGGLGAWAFGVGAYVVGMLALAFGLSRERTPV